MCGDFKNRIMLNVKIIIPLCLGQRIPVQNKRYARIGLDQYRHRTRQRLR